MKGEYTVSAEENKAIVRRFIEEVFNKKNLDVLDEIVDPDYVFHFQDPTTKPIHGVERFKQFMAAIHTAFPDIYVITEKMIAEGDKVEVLWTWHATHKGEFMSIPPTGIHLTFTGIAIHRLAGGKIVESWWNLSA